MPRETILPAFFGRFGGQEVPDFLLPALDELEEAFTRAVADPTFLAELDELRATYLGRPTPIYECRNLPLDGGARIVLKREDLVHGGAHKGNNALGQALLAKRMGKKRLIAETGAGQHGTATAMVAALMGMECTIYMGAHDVARQRPNVERMELMGATVTPVTQGSAGLKDAVDAALSQWCTQLEDTFYVLGSATGPHPFPTLVRYFQAVISAESRRQVSERFSRLPDAVVACVGGGSNAIGACLAAGHVWVVVVDETGQVHANQCVGTPSSGEQALADAGMRLEFGRSRLICTIDAHPASCPSRFTGQYWHYYHALPGQGWTYSQQGAGSRKPPPGSIEGWCYNASDQDSCFPPELLITRDGEVVVPGDSTESTNMVTPRRATASIWRREASGRVRYQGCSALMRSRECSIMAFCARRSESTAGRLRSSMTGS